MKSYTRRAGYTAEKMNSVCWRSSTGGHNLIFVHIVVRLNFRGAGSGPRKLGIGPEAAHTLQIRFNLHHISPYPTPSDVGANLLDERKLSKQLVFDIPRTKKTIRLEI
jgi:hypothetical protein